jgi:hypothetical protein
MTSTNKFAIATLMALVFLSTACTTYVQQPVAQGQGAPVYDPGYNPDNVIADAILTAAILNGVNGYYGPGHVFYPSVMYGGVPGYYVGGVFHTSTTYRTTIVNNYQHDRIVPPAQRTVVVANAPSKPLYTAPVKDGKPQFGQQAGGMTRGPATVVNNTTVNNTTTKPQFGSQAGGMTRGPASSQPTGKPQLGSQSGGMTRSPSTPSPSRSPASSSSSRSSRK